MSPITIGIAGHIDHGKTALTKALTSIETDRLKEEQERHISIENGFAYLVGEAGEKLAVIDVPGHEDFIRQMIAGVAGIDCLLICVAADEGVMPQTLEHVRIADLLHIDQAIFVVTKIELVEKEWLPIVEEAIMEAFQSTRFSEAPFYYVDSLSGKGVDDLKQAIFSKAKNVNKRHRTGPLRLPIDQVFSLHGHGTIIRGTIFDGEVFKEGDYSLLPSNKSVRIKSMQVHYEEVTRAQSGQRVALNVAGAQYNEVRRGDVLVSRGAFQPSLRLDVELEILNSLHHPLKQRMPIVVHQGTTIAQGRFIFFDRNEVDGEEGGTIYGQLELDEPLIVQKGDRFILRRPTPVETLGGGTVLNPLADKHRFGEDTVAWLKKQAEGTPLDWLTLAFENTMVLDLNAIHNLLGGSLHETETLVKEWCDLDVITPLDKDKYVLTETLKGLQIQILEELSAFHRSQPMQRGIKRSTLKTQDHLPTDLIEKVLEELTESERCHFDGPYIRMASFEPHFPEEWKTRMQGVVNDLEDLGLDVIDFKELSDKQQIPVQLVKDLFHFLVETHQAVKLNSDRLIHQRVFQQFIGELKQHYPNGFDVQEAKTVLKGSRKQVIPFLEYLDEIKLTKRVGNSREWV